MRHFRASSSDATPEVKKSPSREPDLGYDHPQTPTARSSRSPLRRSPCHQRRAGALACEPCSRGPPWSRSAPFRYLGPGRVSSAPLTAGAPSHSRVCPSFFCDPGGGGASADLWMDATCPAGGPWWSSDAGATMIGGIVAGHNHARGAGGRPCRRGEMESQAGIECPMRELSSKSASL